MEEVRKKGASDQSAPNEDFLKAQKNKLRDLMLKNSAIENRRSLKMAMKHKDSVATASIGQSTGGDSKPLILISDSPKHRRGLTVQEMAAVPLEKVKLSPQSNRKSLQKFWISNPHEE